ncbi:hypothetical protein BCR36DRAFT_411068, partial [Piromyces finnis]
MESSNNQNGFLQDIFLLTDQLQSYNTNRNEYVINNENKNANVHYSKHKNISNNKKKVFKSNSNYPAYPLHLNKNNKHKNNEINYQQQAMHEIQQFCLDIKRNKKQQSLNNQKLSNVSDFGKTETVLLNDNEEITEDSNNNNFSVMDNHSNKINETSKGSPIMNINLDNSTDDYSSLISDTLTDKSKFNNNAIFSHSNSNPDDILQNHSDTVNTIRKNKINSKYIYEEKQTEIHEPYSHKTFSIESSEKEKKLENARVSINTYNNNVILNKKKKYKLKNLEEAVSNRNKKNDQLSKYQINNKTVASKVNSSSLINDINNNDSPMNTLSYDSSSLNISLLSNNNHNEYVQSNDCNKSHSNKDIVNSMKKPPMNRHFSQTQLKSLPSHSKNHNKKKKYDKRMYNKMRKHKREKEIKKQIEKEVEKEMNQLKNDLMLNTISITNTIPKEIPDKHTGLFQKLFNIPLFKNNNKSKKSNIQNVTNSNTQFNTNPNQLHNWQRTFENYNDYNIKHSSTTLTSSFSTTSTPTSTSNSDLSTTSLTMSDITKNPSLNYSISNTPHDINNYYNVPPLPVILFKSQNSSYVSNINKELPECPSQKQMPSLESINLKIMDQNKVNISNISLNQGGFIPNINSSNIDTINSLPLQKNINLNNSNNNINVSTVPLNGSMNKEYVKKEDDKNNIEFLSVETTIKAIENSFDDTNDNNSFDASTDTKKVKVFVKSGAKAQPENTMNDISEEEFSDLSTESITEDYVDDGQKTNQDINITETNKNSFDDEDETNESKSNSFDDNNKDTEVINKYQGKKEIENNSFDDDESNNNNSFDGTSYSDNNNVKIIKAQQSNDNSFDSTSYSDNNSVKVIKTQQPNDNSFDGTSYSDNNNDVKIIKTQQPNDNSFDSTSYSDNNVKIIKAQQPSSKKEENEKDDWSSSESSSWSSTNDQTSINQINTTNNSVKVIRKISNSPTTSIASISEVSDFNTDNETNNEVSIIKIIKGTNEDNDNSFDEDEDESNWDSENSKISIKEKAFESKPKIIKNNLFDVVDKNKVSNNLKKQLVNEDENIIENSFDDDDESSWDSHNSDEESSKPKVTVIRNNLFSNDLGIDSTKESKKEEMNEILSISSTQSVSAISEVLSSKSEEEDFDEDLSEVKEIDESKQNSFDDSLSTSDSEYDIEKSKSENEEEEKEEKDNSEETEVIDDSQQSNSDNSDFDEERDQNSDEDIESISEKNSFDDSSIDEEVKEPNNVVDDNKNKKKNSFSFLKFGKQKGNNEDKTSSNNNLFKNIKSMSIGSLIGSNSIIVKYKGSVAKKNKNKIRFEENNYDKTYDIINFLFELEDTQSNLLPTIDLTTFSDDKKCAAARVIIKYRETTVKELKRIDRNFMAEADEERIEDVIIRADQNRKKLTEYTTAECGNALMMLIRDVIITKNIYNKFIMNNNCDLKERHITALFNEKQKQLWNIIIGHFVNVIYLSDACVYDISNIIGWNLIPLSLLSLDDIGTSDDIKNLLFKIGNNLQATSHLKNLLFSYHPVLIAYIFQNKKSDHYKMSEMLINFYHGFSNSLSDNKDNESKNDFKNENNNIEDSGYGFGENNILYFVNALIKYCFSTKQSIISKEFEMEILKYYLKYQSIEWVNEVTLKIREKLTQYNNKLDIENITDKSQLKKNISNVKDLLKTLFTSILSLYDSTKTSLGFKYICQQIVMKHSAEYMLEIIGSELLSEELYEWLQKKTQWTTTITRSTKQSFIEIIDLMKNFIKGKRNPNQEWFNEALTKERPILIQQIEIQYGKDIKNAQQVQLDQGQRQGLSIISEDVALISNTSNGLTSSDFYNQPNTKHIREDVMLKKKELAIKQTINYLKINNQYLTKDIIAISSAKNTKQYPLWLFYKINKITLFVERTLRE